jgi:hypothetical protein
MSIKKKQKNKNPEHDIRLGNKISKEEFLAPTVENQVYLVLATDRAF